MIGGLLFSTVLSLVFVPAMFMVMDDVGSLISRFGKRLIVSAGEAEQDQADHQQRLRASPAAPPAIVAPAAE